MTESVTQDPTELGKLVEELNNEIRSIERDLFNRFGALPVHVASGTLGFGPIASDLSGTTKWHLLRGTLSRGGKGWELLINADSAEKVAILSKLPELVEALKEAAASTTTEVHGALKRIREFRGVEFGQEPSKPPTPAAMWELVDQLDRMSVEAEENVIDTPGSSEHSCQITRVEVLKEIIEFVRKTYLGGVE